MAKTKPAPETTEAPALVLLRNLDSQESRPFAPDHAQRLLAYPGTRWAAIDAPGKPDAGAPASDASTPDETGHPHAS